MWRRRASYTRVTRQKETFYGENRGNVYEFAHTAIDNGADIVLGHGPHVTRAVEVYKGKFIAYSMGNFNTYGRFSLAGPNGIAPLLDIKNQSQRRFSLRQCSFCKADQSQRVGIGQQL